MRARARAHERERERGETGDAQLVNADRPQVQCLETPRRHGWPTRRGRVIVAPASVRFSPCVGAAATVVVARASLPEKRTVSPRAYIHACVYLRTSREIARVVVGHTLSRNCIFARHTPLLS